MQTVTVPNDPHMKAIAYLAALAYPSKGDQSKRDRFEKAAKQYLFHCRLTKGERTKAIRPEWRDMDKKNIMNTLNRCGERIVLRRLPAAALLRWRFMGTAGPVHVDGQPVAGAYQAKNAMAETLRRHFGRYDEERNVHQLVWKESLPVLHLAFCLDAHLSDDDVDICGLLLHPAWADKLIPEAEVWRKALAEETELVPELAHEHTLSILTE